jgi:hypothetical protein
MTLTKVGREEYALHFFFEKLEIRATMRNEKNVSASRDSSGSFRSHSINSSVDFKVGLID